MMHREGNRVAPRLLLKYNIRPARALCSAWDDLSSLDEVVEGSTGDVQDLGDRGLGDFLAQQRPDVLLLAVEPGCSQGPLGPAEPFPLGFGSGQDQGGNVMAAGKSSRINRQYKTKYRIRNWREYERGLRSRGDVTIWLSEDAIAAWIPAKNGLRGGQRRYSNLAIRTALTLRVVFGLPLRQTEGFLDSLLSLMSRDLKAPDHTTLSRRNQIVVVPPLTRAHDGPIDLIVDSTGLAGRLTARRQGGRHPALPPDRRSQDRHCQDHGRVPYYPLQLHQHPRAQAESLACISTRIWSVP